MTSPQMVDISGSLNNITPFGLFWQGILISGWPPEGSCIEGRPFRLECSGALGSILQHTYLPAESATLQQ